VSLGLLTETIVMFLMLMLPGILLEKAKLLPDPALSGLTNVVMYTAMPALVFVKLLQTDFAVLSVAGILCCALLPFIVGSVLLLITWELFRCGLLEEFPVSGVCSAFPNCGFWSIPLAGALFPDRPEVAVYVSIFNVFNTYLLLTAGGNVLSGEKKRIQIWKLLGNPVAAAILLGVLLSSLRISVPVLEKCSVQLSRLATPLSMLVLGAEAAKLKLGEIFCNARLYLVCLIKLIISPIVAMSILDFVFIVLELSVTDTLKNAIFWRRLCLLHYRFPAWRQNTEEIQNMQRC